MRRSVFAGAICAASCRVFAEPSAMMNSPDLANTHAGPRTATVPPPWGAPVCAGAPGRYLHSPPILTVWSQIRIGLERMTPISLAFPRPDQYIGRLLGDAT